MHQPQPSPEEISAEKAKREAYLLRRLGPDGLWRWQQQALSDLAKLRPDGGRPSRTTPGPKPDNLKTG